MSSTALPFGIMPFSSCHLEDVALLDKLCFIDPWLKRSFIHELDAPCALNIVAFSPDNALRTLGYCLARVVKDECSIHRLGVHPGHRRSGIATGLLGACLRRARRQGACWCCVDVRAGNTAAQRLYLKHGFRPVGTRRSYYAVGAEDALLMRKEINPAGANNPLDPEYPTDARTTRTGHCCTHKADLP